MDAADLATTPSVGRLLLRNATIWISPAGLFSAQMHPDKMRFGDRLAGTMVVEETHDPTSSVIARRLFKAMVFIGAVLLCFVSSVFGYSRYVRNSALYEIGRDFVLTYEPLHAVVEDLSADKLNLMVARYRTTDNEAWAVLIFTHRTETYGVQTDVVMSRGADKGSPWSLKDASGLVKFPGEGGQEDRIFAFVHSRDFHRFLTEDEVTKIFKERKPPVEIIPELKDEEKPTVSPPEGGPKP